MSSSATVRVIGDTKILDLEGQIILGDSANQLRETVQGLTGGGATKLVLNLAGVTYMDSAGLGELVACYNTLSQAGGRLALTNVQSKVSGLLRMTKLDSLFEVFATDEEAVSSFA